MSALEEQQEIQRLSGIKVSQTAKGEPVVTVHVYVGATDDELAVARDQAIRLYHETCAAVRGAPA